MDFKVFISEVEKQPAILDIRDISIRTGKLKQKRVYASKECKQGRAFNVDAAFFHRVMGLAILALIDGMRFHNVSLQLT